MPNYKGFDKDLKCIGFQYEIGKEYEIDEKPIRCTNSGFHSCEHPLDVLGYYEPGDSRYCEVEVDGQIDKDNSDTKVASSKIKIGAEIGFFGLFAGAAKFVFEKVTNDPDTKKAYNDSGHAAAQGYSGHAAVSGKDAIAAAFGVEGKAKAALGSWIMLAEWFRDENYKWHIKTVNTAKVDGVKVKADIWYELKNGKFIEVVES